jgi:hypothetical protein
MSNRAEACVRGRIGDDRVLIHLCNERKQNLLFFLNVREHLGTKFFKQLFDILQFRSAIASLGRKLLGHLGQSRQLLAHILVMDTNNMLNQLADG